MNVNPVRADYEIARGEFHSRALGPGEEGIAREMKRPRRRLLGTDEAACRGPRRKGDNAEVSGGGKVTPAASRAPPTFVVPAPPRKSAGLFRAF
jgi:hypothetical protein